jgi:hypothetical protein
MMAGKKGRMTAAEAMAEHKFTATVNFANVWTVVSADNSAFALPGDSGSLVVTEDGQFAVGLLFAVSSDGLRAWVAPMDVVLAALPEFFLATGIL